MSILDDLNRLAGLFYNPKLYYVEDSEVEKGQVIYVKETDYMPEFIVINPDDEINIPNRELVHLRDMPPEIVQDKIRKQAEISLRSKGWIA